MRILDVISSVLLVIGGLNWLLVGALQFDLVASIFDGEDSPLTRLIYIVVGLSAVWMAIRLPAIFDRAYHGAPVSRRGKSSV